MKTSRYLFTGLAATALSVSAISAISANAGAAEPASASHAAVQAVNPAVEGAPACSVHLWDGDNFTDDDIVVSGPGRFKNLKNLPGANGKDWGDDADSLKVGSAATVTSWSKPGFKGKSVTYRPGSSHPELDSEPGSLEISCR